MSVSVRTNMLVTMGVRAGCMEAAGCIELPAGSAGEDAVAVFVASKVDTYRSTVDDMGFDEYIERELMKKYGKVYGTCKRCGAPLYKSQIEGYTCQCLECDEDFYAIEQNVTEENAAESVFADIFDYLVFCDESSKDYPFATSYFNTTILDLHKIEELCNGDGDIETIHAACVQVLGKGSFDEQV